MIVASIAGSSSAARRARSVNSAGVTATPSRRSAVAVTSGQLDDAAPVGVGVGSGRSG
jgi:hypothetical protein